MLCERCHREMYKFVVCDYCHRKIGYECIKSSKKKSNTVKLVICKDDWSKMSKRKAYKNLNATAA